MGVSVVMPAFNEAKIIPETLAALRGLSCIGEIIVVDDGSTDGTATVARGPKTRVFQRHRNRGKGAALQYGVARAKGNIVVLLDGDLGATAAKASALIGPVRRGEADVVIATFGARRPAGFGIVQRFARVGIRGLCGLTMTSPLSGQRAIHRRVLEVVPGFAPGFGAEVAFTIDAARAGFVIVEVPVDFAHNETGRDVRGFLHRGTQLGHVGKALLSRVLTRGRQIPLSKTTGADNS